MGSQGQHNGEQDERARYYAETTWRQRAADRARAVIVIAVPLIIAAAVYWIAN